MSKRAAYVWQDIGPYIIVEDCDGPVSVTNDAERVIEDLVTANADVFAKRVIYQDSDGRWDGLATHQGRFVAFKLFHASTHEIAFVAWGPKS